MKTPLNDVFAITMFVEDPQRSKLFYTDIFGVSVLFEDDTSVAFKFESIIVNLITMPSAHELIDPGKVADLDSGSRFQLTVTVADVDAVCAELAANGVTLVNGPMDRYWGMRTACFTDLDGHMWEVAQEIAAAPQS